MGRLRPHPSSPFDTDTLSSDSYEYIDDFDFPSLSIMELTLGTFRDSTGPLAPLHPFNIISSSSLTSLTLPIALVLPCRGAMSTSRRGDVSRGRAVFPVREELFPFREELFPVRKGCSLFSVWRRWEVGILFVVQWKHAGDVGDEGVMSPLREDDVASAER